MTATTYKERRIKQDEEIETLKNELINAHGIERDIKFEKAFDLAWDLGHSSGYDEVKYYFGELVDLIK